MKALGLDDARHRFGEAMGTAPGVEDPRIGPAFAKVPRESFVGAGPWRFLASNGYVDSTSDDPGLLYADVVVALAPEKRINNGQPSLHARCMSAARIRPGDRVLHVGCGTGYYTAILAELTTEAGRVTAWDVEQELVTAAVGNLKAWPNVAVELRSGTIPPIPPCEVIYVSAGCTRPLKMWIDALTQGGRLLFPLTPGWDYGGILKVVREGVSCHAEFICRCSFIPCNGGSDPAMEQELRQAFLRGGTDSVASLHFNDSPGKDCWFAGNGWWLSLGGIAH